MAHSSRDLVDRAQLGLKLLVAGRGVDQEISWVASSDLPDPTPFLESGHFLLTTGHQFADTDFVVYVSQLVEHGVLGIGFGTEVLRAGVPDGLLDACREARMTLVEVPYRTPFIAVIRWVAREIERSARRRDEWALEALRSIPAAALAGNARAALTELAHRVEGSIQLHDRSGRIASPVGGIRLSEESGVALIREVEKLLALGRRVGSDVVLNEGTATFQTLGPSGRLAGVLVVLTPDRLDRAARLVVNAVVALLEVALWHEDRAEISRRGLADRALGAAIQGDVELARALVESTGMTLPEPPFLVTSTTLPTPSAFHAARGVLEDVGALAGVVDDVLLSISPVTSWHFQVSALGGRSGVVVCESWAMLALSVERSQSARRRATSGEPIARWEDIRPHVLDVAVESPAMTKLATASVESVLADPHGEELLRCAAVWLQQDARWDTSANILGIHRHSLRARMVKLGSMLDLDLESFTGRVELHLLLSAATK